MWHMQRERAMFQHKDLLHALVIVWHRVTAAIGAVGWSYGPEKMCDMHELTLTIFHLIRFHFHALALSPNNLEHIKYY